MSMTRELGEWLAQLGLGQHAVAFAENDVDWAVLPDLDDEYIPQGAIPAILPELSEEEADDLFAAREKITTALGQSDLTQLPQDLQSTVESLRAFMAS